MNYWVFNGGGWQFLYVLLVLTTSLFGNVDELVPGSACYQREDMTFKQDSFLAYLVLVTFFVLLAFYITLQKQITVGLEGGIICFLKGPDNDVVSVWLDLNGWREKHQPNFYLLTIFLISNKVKVRII